jgi:thiol-disulfide isomerase/thioredoxin
MRRSALRLALLLLLLPLLVSAAPEGKKETRKAWDFRLQDINPASATYGDLVSIADLYAERGVVLNFMASWCGPCRIELPELQQIAAADEATVACVAADEYGAGPTNVLTVIERAKLTVPVLFAPEAAAAKIARHYRYQTIPATYLIDREGTIRQVHQGVRPKSKLLRDIDQLLRAD